MTTAENQSLIPELDGRAGVRGPAAVRVFRGRQSTPNPWMISVVTLALAASASASWSGQHSTLLQERDAAKLRHTNQEWPNVPHTLNSSAGPIIDVEKPKVVDEENGPTIEAATPVNIDVLFQPRNTPVDQWRTGAPDAQSTVGRAGLASDRRTSLGRTSAAPAWTWTRPGRS